jgi:hypothetical protein
MNLLIPYRAAAAQTALAVRYRDGKGREKTPRSQCSGRTARR